MAASFAEKLISPVYHLAGAVTFLVLVYAAQPGSNLFSWHPILMSLGVAVLMAKAVVSFNSSFNTGIVQSANRAASVVWHFYLQVGALVSLLVGLAVIYQVKNASNKPHFTSWHGLLGVGVVAGSVMGACGGIAANNAAKLRHLVPPAQLKWGHSLLGTLLFSVACVVLALGVTSNWALGSMSRLQRCLVGSLALGMAAVVWDQARRGFLLRPFAKSSGDKRQGGGGGDKRQGSGSGGSNPSSPRNKGARTKK